MCLITYYIYTDTECKNSTVKEKTDIAPRQIVKYNECVETKTEYNGKVYQLDDGKTVAFTKCNQASGTIQYRKCVNG